jgi:NAD(P)H-dependent FMN reductase
MPARILVFAGSARRDSLNKKLARVAAQESKAAGFDTTFIDLDDFPMPVYHGDLESEKGMPENGLKLREIFIAHDALLIASPENNQSMTALLKNTIDWLSRDLADGKGANSGFAPFHGKVAGMLAASPGAFGGVRHLPHLRQCLGTLGVLVLGTQVPVPRAHEAFDEAGQLKDARTLRAVKQLVAELGQAAGKLAARGL